MGQPEKEVKTDVKKTGTIGVEQLLHKQRKVLHGAYKADQALAVSQLP